MFLLAYDKRHPMSAKKVPRGGFDMKDIEKHRINMAEVCLEIRSRYGHTNGKSVPSDIVYWRFPSMKEPRQSSLWAGHGVCFWNYRRKCFDTPWVGDPTAKVRLHYTGNPQQPIGSASLTLP